MLRERDLDRVRRGDLDFGAYAVATGGEWLALARWVRGRWIVPPSVGVEDVMQELLLAAWTAINKWDPERGYPLRRYVVWCSISAAAHWLHVQRQAKGQRGTSPSRFPVEGVTRSEHREPSAAASPEQVAMAREALARALGRLGNDERDVVGGIIETGDPSLVAGLLYRDVEFRRRHRLGSEQEARRFAHSALRRVVSDVS